MAPSDKKDGAEKYKGWSLSQLQDECKKRKLIFEHLDEAGLIALLVKNDQKPTDWARIYSTILFHTGMHYEEIGRRTLPQINALLDLAGENISIKIGMPNIFGHSTGDKAVDQVPQQEPGAPPKLSQFAAMAAMFDRN